MPPTTHEQVSAYRSMWLFVFFDFPTTTPKTQKIAARFRKRLLCDGFSMMQYSVYIRHCASLQRVKKHTQRVQRIIPQEGHVDILQVTDHQFGEIIHAVGSRSKPLPIPPVQLEIF